MIYKKPLQVDSSVSWPGWLQLHSLPHLANKMKVMRRDSFSQRGKSLSGVKEWAGVGRRGQTLRMPFLQDGDVVMIINYRGD